MKTKFLTLAIITFLGLSLTHSSSDNDCKSFYPLIKGYKWVYNNYDKKDKLEDISTTLVSDVKSSGDAIEYVMDVKSESAKPKKDEEPFERTISYFCRNGVLSVDMSTLLPSEYGEMDITIEQNEMTLPSSLKEGQTLEDAQVKVFVNGMQLMQMDITNRKCEKYEEITTGAGTFNCAVISYDVTSKVAFMTVLSSSKEWYSPKVGQVMTETYDKNGKKQSSRKLVEFSTGN